ncbi:MAG: phosphoribosylamine--glycine ligase, partial [Alphaproteobacteria bacterium]|nr:phosphoribosylamine--glycine ligase [Alphaproteobacteria bacterium]
SIVVEEFLTGEEASFHVLVDGRTALPLAGAQDHKAAFDGDQGPNTGGMGAYSPAPVLTAELAERVMKSIILPTVAAMTEEGRMFKGVLYAGLMIEKGVAKLLEYNCRFGDPECQVLMARLDSDLLPALIAAREGTLDKLRLAWRDEAAVSVVMAAKGYPGPYRKGTPIRGLDAAAEIEKTTVFHAGTARREGGRIEAVGGRVLGVTALGTTVAEAQARAYRAVDKVVWPDGFCRRDIGWRAVARETRGV